MNTVHDVKQSREIEISDVRPGDFVCMNDSQCMLCLNHKFAPGDASLPWWLCHHVIQWLFDGRIVKNKFTHIDAANVAYKGSWILIARS